MAGEKMPSSVEYNWLSDNSGIKVANICLGTMTFGKPVKRFSIPGNTDEAGSVAILDRYFELGGNFLDTANVYCNGESEEIIGSWMSSRDRGSVFLATKVFAGGDLNERSDSFPNHFGLSRGSIMHNIDQSLRRLKTDYIDLYYTHCYDFGANIEETLRALNDLVRCGKVRYVGLSNMTGSTLQKVMDYNKFMGFNPCVTLQQRYNLASRDSDIEVVPTCLREGLSLIPYSPLGGGLLTGKFKRDDPNPSATLAGTRLGWVSEKPKERGTTAAPNIEDLKGDENFWKLMGAVEAVGKAHGKTPGQVSLRWLLQKDFIPSVIIGAKSVQQLEENMVAGTGWKLTEEEVKQLDDLSTYAGAIPRYPYKTIELWNAGVGRLRSKKL